MTDSEMRKFTPLGFETMLIFDKASINLERKFTPLGFETLLLKSVKVAPLVRKFTPLGFETSNSGVSKFRRAGVNLPRWGLKQLPPSLNGSPFLVA